MYTITGFEVVKTEKYMGFIITLHNKKKIKMLIPSIAPESIRCEDKSMINRVMINVGENEHSWNGPSLSIDNCDKYLSILKVEDIEKMKQSLINSVIPKFDQDWKFTVNSKLKYKFCELNFKIDNNRRVRLITIYPIKDFGERIITLCDDKYHPNIKHIEEK